jgi:WD40 repeat protein
MGKWNVSNKHYTNVFKISDSGLLHSEIPNSDSSKLIGYCEDRSICIYNLKSNKIHARIEGGHSETIFDLKYNPNDSGIFGTCSYDGSIKIWDMKKNKLINNINLDNNLTYHKTTKNLESQDNIEEKNSFLCILWSPNEKNLLISGDSKSWLRLWDVKKEKLLDSNRIFTTGKNNKDNSVLGIDWDKNDNIIAAAGLIIKLFKYVNGKLTQNSAITPEFYSPVNVYQVKFNPFFNDNKKIFVCCLDGVIRIYNETSKKSINELISHEKKVFAISFNSSKKDFFATSSDDFKIGIWDLNKSQKANFLCGHTNKVRQILWFREKEESNILISGSWDGNIKFWDIDSMSCIYTIFEHYSDVYGLDICHDYPYLLISTSRDNSIRFWNLPFLADKMVIYS